MLGRPLHGGGEAGETLAAVMVAVALVGIAAAGLMTTAANSQKVQAAVRLAGQREDLRNVFRGAFVCQTNCNDVIGAVPPNIGSWDIRASCASAGSPVTLSTRNAQYENGAWTPLFAKGDERAVCKQGIVPLPGATATKGQTGHLRQCPYGQVVDSVDFTNQSVTCRSNR